MNLSKNLLVGIGTTFLVILLIIGLKNCIGRTNDKENISYNGANQKHSLTSSVGTDTPKDLEALVIKEINDCRQNPSQYADNVLIPFLKSMSNGIYLYQGKQYSSVEGETAVIEAINCLRDIAA